MNKTPYLKDEICFLDRIKFQDKKFIYFFLSKNNGLIKAIVKETSKNYHLLNLASIYEANFYQKKEWCYLIDSKNLFSIEKLSYEDLFLLTKLNRFIKHLISAEEKNLEIFNLLKDFLKVFKLTNKRNFLFNIFLIKFLNLLGYLQDLSFCKDQKINPQKKYKFSLENGGFVEDNTDFLDFTLIKVIVFSQKNNFFLLDKIKISYEQIFVLEKISTQIFKYFNFYDE
jgi:recombinational DNA repair protein (RecF pathway)